MLDKLSRELPLGILFLLVSGWLASGLSSNALGILLVHLGAAGLAILLFRRAGSLGNIIVVAHLTVVLLFSIFCAYVLTIVDHVAAEPVFEFAVFTPESVKRALLLNDFGLGVMLLVYGCHSAMQRPSHLLSFQGWGGSVRMVRIPPQIFVAGLYLSWGIIIGSVILTPSILQFPYPENNFQPWALHPTARAILVLIPFSLFLVKFAQDQFQTQFIGLALRITTYAAILGVGLLGGARGAAVGLLIGLIALDITQSRDAVYRKWLGVFISIVLAVFAVVNWPYMRFLASDVGLIPSFVMSFAGYEFLFSVKSSSASMFLSDFPMLGQSLFHFLYVIALIDSGASLHYQTFLNLIPQQLPNFLDGILWERPINDNWLLADQFRHSGGFYSFANAYWNGGIPALGLFSAVLAWVFARIEILFKTLPTYYGAAYFMMILLVPVGFYYGIQGLMRGIQYGLIACLLIKIVTKIAARSGAVTLKNQSSLFPANTSRVR